MPLDEVQPENVESSVPVVIFTAPNPGPKTLGGTHSYLVGRRLTYLIDPGPDLPAYQEAVVKKVIEHGHAVQGILLSHEHPDHAPGAPRLKQLLNVPVWASAAIDRDAAIRLEVDERFGENQKFRTDQDVLRVIAAPGHSRDHVVFWLEGARILFSGDTILGEGSSLIAPPEGDMTKYLETLEALRALDARLIAPGHGPIIREPRAKIDEYVEHRRERERQVLQALSRGPASINDLVLSVYTDVSPELQLLARGSVQAQLIKLEKEGRVERQGESYRLVSHEP